MLDWPWLVVRVVLVVLLVLPLLLIFGALHSLLSVISGKATFTNRTRFFQDSWAKVWAWTLEPARQK